MSLYQILHTNIMSEYKAVMSEYVYKPGKPKNRVFRAFSGTGGEPVTGASSRYYDIIAPY